MSAPVALEIARLSALTAVFLSVIGVAVALLQSRLDRLRARPARSVTAVVDLDDDGSSMLAAIEPETCPAPRLCSANLASLFRHDYTEARMILTELSVVGILGPGILPFAQL